MMKPLFPSVLAIAGLSMSALPALSADPVMDPYVEVADERVGLVFAAIGGVSAGYGWVESSEDVVDDAAQIGGFGRVSIPVGEMLSLQFDAEGEGRFTDEASSGDDEDPLGIVLGGVHASWRDPSRGLLGVFGGIGRGFNEDDDEVKLGWLVGAEGQIYLNEMVTFYAQAGFADFEVDDDPEGFVDGWFARGVARYFATPEALIEGELSYGETDRFIDGDDKGEFWAWGLKGKMRLNNDLPIYGTLAYRGATYDATTEDDDGKEHVVTAGLSFVFGPRTLQENDRLGATLDLPLLPVRAASWTEGLD